MEVENLNGRRFDRLVVVGFAGKRKKALFWKCACDCGNEKEVWSADLKRGTTRSCGCLQREIAASRVFKHGLVNHHLYATWLKMRNRCNNPDNDGYYLYGGRGISCCKEWDEFSVFAADMGPSWSEGLTLDRVDVNGNYSKDNCRWATPREQANNRRTNRIIETPDGPMTIADAARRFGVKPGTIQSRLRYGWTDPSKIFSSERYPQ